jgi:leucyl aminopeptidase
LGSQAVFSEYEKTGRDVKAMFQQDMTGFIKLTVDAGKKPEFGLMMDISLLPGSPSYRILTKPQWMRN